MQRKLLASTLVTTACASVLSLDVLVAAQGSLAQVVVLPQSESPVSINFDRMDAATDPATIAFSATNVASPRISTYGITVYIFPPPGQGAGYVFAQQRPATDFEAGQSHQVMMSLSRNRTYDAATILILAVRSVTFEDGTRWNAPQNLIQQVNEDAASLRKPVVLGR